ncbi:MAG: hypothetical protein MRZ29_09240, partial [Oscillospiraceae bacterium]|nr:hypothetical protein [Oscillospiraceae bacterium]
MKKISVLLVICMIVCTIPFASFAADVYTQSITDEGIVTYVNDFQNENPGATYTNDTNGIHYATAGNTKFKIRGDNSNYLEMQQTVENKTPSMTINFLKTDASPKINSLANAQKYTVKFKMRVSPAAASKTQLYMDCGARWSFYINASGKTYNIFCNDKKVSAEVTKAYSCTTTFSDSSDGNSFRNYEISIDRKNNTAALKVDGTLLYKDAPLYTGCSFDSLKFIFQKTLGRLAIDDIKVTVTDTASCSDTNWSEATNINFDNFEIGTIPNKENSNIGGFENGNTLYSSNGYAYIDYKYDDAAPETVDKYLKITKNAKGDEIGVNKPFSVKRDISSITENYSEYEVSFKIKNELDKNGTAFVRLGDGGSGNEGAVISISSYAIVKYRDYSVVNSNDEKAWITVSSKAEQGVWTDVKLKIYRDEKKADLYIGDMSTPAAEKIPTNHKVGGDYLVFAPQKSATGSISVDNIVINPVTEADYALTYTTGADDLAKYTSSGVTAQCKIKEGKEAPVIIIAQYGADGRLINTALSGNTENGTVSAALSAPSAQTGEYVS